MEGFIVLRRKLLKWQWADSPKHMALFIHLLMRANYKQTMWRDQTINAGQLLTGRKQLCTWTGISESTVYRVLNDLENSGEVNIKKTNKFSIITITNWSKYQSREQQMNNKRTTNEQQMDTSNKVNKENNIIYADKFDFEAAYQEYPRKDGKTQGIKKCRSMIKTQQDYDSLVQAIRNYKTQVIAEGRDKTKIKYFSSFMSSWRDYIEIEESFDTGMNAFAVQEILRQTGGLDVN